MTGHHKFTNNLSGPTMMEDTKINVQKAHESSTASPHPSLINKVR